MGFIGPNSHIRVCLLATLGISVMPDASRPGGRPFPLWQAFELLMGFICYFQGMAQSVGFGVWRNLGLASH